MIAQLTEVVLAFGSNLGDRARTIRDAQRELSAHEAIRSFVASPLRETLALTPDGVDPDAPRYLNGVASFTTTLSPAELHELTRAIEDEFGRVRHDLWGDRTLDIDIIVFGGKVVAEPELSIPHPRAHERDFVLAPWLEIDPNAVLIGHGRVSALLAQMGDTTLAFDEQVTA